MINNGPLLYWYFIEYIHTSIFDSLQLSRVARRFKFSLRNRVFILLLWFFFLHIGQTNNTVIHSSVMKMQGFGIGGQKAEKKGYWLTVPSYSKYHVRHPNLFSNNSWKRFLVPVACLIEHRTVFTHKHTLIRSSY